MARKESQASRVVYVRCTPDEKARWEFAAARDARSVSAWLRRAGNAALPRDMKIDVGAKKNP